MPETVECSECGTSYDSQEHPFCPRCGSTSRGQPLPGAVVAASRRDPGRRRVQAAGGVLLAIGLLFLLSAAVSLVVPAEEAAAPLVDAMAGQPGGDVRLTFPATEPAGTARLLAHDGHELANGTATDGVLTFSAEKASVRVEATQGDAHWNRTVLVLRGDTARLDLPAGGDGGGEGNAEAGTAAPKSHEPVVLSPQLRTAAAVARYTLLAIALLLASGGLCALLLRGYGLAAAGAVAGAVLGLLALVGFLALGLLFAIPFGLCAYFILRGRRHFRGAGAA